MKTLYTVENISRDMYVRSFETKIGSLKEFLMRVDLFLQNVVEVQNVWKYSLYFVKFAVRGEFDRDCVRLFNNCTEDIKKYELILQQNIGNVTNALKSNNADDLELFNLKTNLTQIMEDVHSNIQSIIDTCPRLSLLSYEKLSTLYKIWMIGPSEDTDLLNNCFQELFVGVGSMVLNISQKYYICIGVVSIDRSERVMFSEPIQFTMSLDEFVKALERQIRMTMENACDVLILNRLNHFKVYLTEFPSDIVLQDLNNIFSVRVSKLLFVLSDQYPNQCYIMINYVSFSEDVWLCLGYPTGLYSNYI